jgi:hypothetical protein
MHDIVCPPILWEAEAETVEIAQEVEPEEPTPAEEPAKPARKKGKNA